MIKMNSTKQAWRTGLLVGLCGVLCQAAEPSAPVIPPLPSEDRPLAERFAAPPASARILRIIHAQRDNPAEQDRQLRTLAAQGFGGFAGNVAFDGYVDDETKWPAFLRGVRLAKAAGMSLWLYDECGYPSGSARDLTLRGHPEWAARGLLVADTNTSGGAVSLALPPGQLVLAAALPRRDGIIMLDESRDLRTSIHDGQLLWQAPPGDWFVVAMTDDLIYEGTHAAISLAFKKPCIDLLTPEPTGRFLEVTHERYAERLGPDLGDYFVSTFTDEPSLQNLWFRPMPYRVLPWSLTIEREFRERRGKELRPLLPALVAEAGPAGTRARCDFWNTVGGLVSENYFGQIQSWCHKHNILSGGHLLMEESLVGHVPLYGHFFRCLRRLDAPSIDCLTSLPPQVPWHVARMIGSAADLEGRTVTMCEVSDHSQRYRREGDTRPVRIVTEDEIRGTCNRLVWGGINTLTSYYAFQDLTDEQLRRINTHVGRCQTMLRGGHQVTDIAVLYPIESVWPVFIPSHRGATDQPAAHRIESVFDGVSSALYAANRDFAYVDSQALCEAEVADDALAVGDSRWRVLVLPAVDTLPRQAWENVVAFWRRGGVVIAIGTRPANSEREFPSPQVKEIARELFGTKDAPCVVTNSAGGTGVLLPTGMISLVPRVVDSLFEPAATCTEEKSPIKVTCRRIDEHDVYFAINDSDAVWEGEIQFCGRGVSEQWDPASGTMTPVTDGRQVPLRLGAYDAMLYRSATANVSRRLGGTVDDSFSMNCESLPETLEPAVSQGQFVQSELTGDDSSGWRAAATLTKGQVDTFLFLSFRYAQSLDLTQCEGLAIEASVPPDQDTAAELLVFLNTTDGDRFLGRTGRYLNSAGSRPAYAMFSQFKPFGDTRGELDLSRIASISVGWGGYFGTEGEQITFTARPPAAWSFYPRIGTVCVADQPEILTPPPAPQPRINGAKIFGVRPGHPLLYTIAATGRRPMKFSVANLPDGLQVDQATGQITGSLSKRGTYRVVLRAENALGHAERELRIEVGDRLLLTPLLGCNTWGGWGAKVTDANLRSAAKAMVDTGLINHGWQYINIDDGWQGQRGGPYNAIQPNEKFTDMRALCDYIHRLGLKAGIYSTPWTTSYAGFVGGSSDDPNGAWQQPQNRRDGWRVGKYLFETNDARQCVAWGFDYAKYDWSVDRIELTRRMADALAACNRDIVMELSNSVPLDKAAQHTSLAQLSRTTGDLVDFWDRERMPEAIRGWAEGVREVWLAHDVWAPYQKPGHWNHACNIRIGLLGGWRDKPLTPTHLTPDEQYTHISLWCLWGSPMIIGTPIERLDPFTLSLLSNDEVLEINQDPLGIQGRRAKAHGGEAVVKPLEDGSKAVGLFNPGAKPTEVAIDWSTLGLQGKQRVRDLWRQKDLGVHTANFTADVRSHGVVLVRLVPASSTITDGEDALP